MVSEGGGVSARRTLDVPEALSDIPAQEDAATANSALFQELLLNGSKFMLRISRHAPEHKILIIKQKGV